jgi:hypothetical protein
VFQYLSGGAEETDGKPQSEDWISWLDFNWAPPEHVLYRVDPLLGNGHQTTLVAGAADS